jgi:transposase
MWYVGLDTHLNTSTCCILDHRGKKIKVHTIRGPWSAMVAFLRSRHKPLAVCYEASCGYGPLYDALASFCHRVVMAHPGRLRLIFRSKQKNDRIDAEKLAKLLYLDEVPQAYVPALDVRAWREMIHFRHIEVTKRTRIQNQLRALLRSQAIAAPRELGGLWSCAGRAWLASIDWADPMSKMRCRLLLRQIEEANASIQQVCDELNTIAQAHPGVALLRTIAGVGPRTAEAVVAYLDDPRRFGRANRVAAYVGLVPSQDSSAGRERLGRVTKQGPAVLRYLLIEAAWQVIRRDPFMRAYFEQIHAGRKENRKKALVATAHKLLRAMYAMLRSGEVWNPPAPAVR